jgi:hypothetical protein
VRPGEPDHYDGRLDGAFLACSTCECPGFLRWGWHRTPEGPLVSCERAAMSEG